ncbi:hypothetical protein [Polyangium spumosum]|uniref:Uncharacterized protein n=1 Tax=Polyangium spumosum TaxID=889282 RepID=A0A6N7PLT9_9BACT|nr:hypothetical protein [Polyangium spumosum]MRG93112.1 hypothetical protein [Polyangium spumosum]
MNMVRPITLATITLLAGLGLGCSKGSSGPEPAGSAATPEAKPDAKGIEAAGNDAAVVELAKKALGCNWGAYGFDSRCPEMKALTESELVRDGKADATLVNFLEDPNEHVRWLGSRILSQRGKAFRTDKALAERIVVVAEGEKSKTVAQELGGVVGGIKHADTGLGDRIKKMAKEHAVQQMRTSLLARMLFSNGETLYDFVKDIATNDKDTIVRKAAMSAFWTGTPPNRAADSCKMWLAFVDDPADDVSGEAAYLTAFYPQGGGCKAEWDPLLDKIEKRAKEGTVKSTQMSSALFYLHRHAGSSDAQKKRALVVARAIVENKANVGMARGRALELVAEKDPDAKKLLEKLQQEDTDVFVKRRAKDLVDKASKPADDKAKAPAAEKAKGSEAKKP